MNRTFLKGQAYVKPKYDFLPFHTVELELVRKTKHYAQVSEYWCGDYANCQNWYMLKIKTDNIGRQYVEKYGSKFYL